MMARPRTRVRKQAGASHRARHRRPFGEAPVTMRAANARWRPSYGLKTPIEALSWGEWCDSSALATQAGLWQLIQPHASTACDQVAHAPKLGIIDDAIVEKLF